MSVNLIDLGLQLSSQLSLGNSTISDSSSYLMSGLINVDNDHIASCRTRGDILNQRINGDVDLAVLSIGKHQLQISTISLTFRIGDNSTALNNHILRNIDCSADICTILSQMIGCSKTFSSRLVLNDSIGVCIWDNDLQTFLTFGLVKLQSIASSGRKLHLNSRLSGSTADVNTVVASTNRINLTVDLVL